jgi:hypothetical protein
MSREHRDSCLVAGHVRERFQSQVVLVLIQLLSRVKGSAVVVQEVGQVSFQFLQNYH